MLRDRLTRRLRPVRRAVLSRRRSLAALLAAAAVAGGVHAATTPPPAAVTVLTAARDLPAGTLLGTDDLVASRFAPGSVPSGVADDAVGRTLAAAVRRGEPVTDVRLVGPALTEAEPTRVALPLRLPDAAMVALLDVGDRVDVLATDPQGAGAQVVAVGVPVLAIPAPDDPTVAGQPGALVVVGAEPADVTALAEASVRYFLSFAFAR